MGMISCSPLVTGVTDIISLRSHRHRQFVDSGARHSTVPKRNAVTEITAEEGVLLGDSGGGIRHEPG